LLRHDVTFPLYIEVDRIFNLACPASPIHLESRADDPRRREPDIRAARETLGWTPRVALADGLRETIAYFRRTLAA
jgi:nucleoside-diphosphate-sugar epimerase